MTTTGHNIVVVGTSAGGLDALDQLVGRLPTDLAAAIFVVQHLSPETSGAPLIRRLGRHKAFQAKLAKEGERFKRGRIYVAPPDNHLLIKSDRMLVRKGARENRNRPGIDPMFRSAAVAHGARVIGVILTGMLDDGTAGMNAIKRCGGTTVVQDPKEAAYPGMPQSVIDNVGVDHCVTLDAMSELLTTLVLKPRTTRARIPADIRSEAEIAERVLSDIGQVEGLGDQVPYNCPDCGGPLWEMKTPKVKRYRCHTGHSFTQQSLLAGQSDKIEEILWISLRMFEERKNLLTSMAKKTSQRAASASQRQRIGETQKYIERIRAMLIAPDSADPADTLTTVKGLMAEPRWAKSARRRVI